MSYRTLKSPPVVSVTSQARRSTLATVSHFMLVLATAAISLFALFEQSFAIIIVFGLFAVVGYVLVAMQGATPKRIFMLIYGTSTIIAILLYIIYINRYGTPYYIGGSDDLAYEQWGQATATHLAIFEYSSIRGQVVARWHNSVGYVYLVSLLYRLGDILGGFHTMIPRLFNGMCLALLSSLVYLMSQRLELPNKLSVSTALFVGLLPIMVYNAVHTFRDTFIALLLFVIIYLWTPNQTGQSTTPHIIRWGITLLLVLVLSQVRYYQAVAILLIVIATDILSFARQRTDSLKEAYVIFILLLMGLFLFFQNQTIIETVGALEASQDGYAEYRADISEGLSTYVFSVSGSVGYALRIGYGLISPLPVLSTQIDRLWLSIGTLTHYLFLPFIGIGIIQVLPKRSRWPILMAFIVLFGGVVFFTFTSRHITQYLPYAVILSAIGFERYGKYRLPIWIIVGCVGLGLLLVYLVLRANLA